MKKWVRFLAKGERIKPVLETPVLLCLFSLFTLAISNGETEKATLRLAQTVPLAGVDGRIDHLAVDLKGNRLFVAALGNNTVEVIDLNAGKLAKSLTGFHEPQGVAFLPDSNRIVI